MTDPITTVTEMREAAARVAFGYLAGEGETGWAFILEARIRALPIARPVAGAEMVEKVARALCEGAIGGRCACSGEFSCADEYPGRQARAALAAMGYEVRE